MYYLRSHVLMPLLMLLLLNILVIVTVNMFVSCDDDSRYVNKQSWEEQQLHTGIECNVSVDNVDDEFTVFMCADSGEYSGAHELGFLYNSLEYRHDVKLDYCHQAAIGLLQHADGHYLKALVVTSGIGYLTAGLCTRSVLRLHAEHYLIDFFDQTVSALHSNFVNVNGNTSSAINVKQAANARKRQWECTKHLLTKEIASMNSSNRENNSVEDKSEEGSIIIKYKSIIYIGTAGFSPWVGGWNPSTREHQQVQRRNANNNTFEKTPIGSRSTKKSYTESFTALPSPYITLSAYKERQEMQEKRARRRGRSLLDKLHVNFEHVISQRQLHYDGCSPLIMQANDNNNNNNNDNNNSGIIQEHEKGAMERYNREHEHELCDVQADTYVTEQVNTIHTRCNKYEGENINDTFEVEKHAHIINDANANNSDASSIDRETTEQLYKENWQQCDIKEEQQQQQQQEHRVHRRVAVGSVCVTAGAFLQESTTCTEDVVYSQCSRLECDDMELDPRTHQTHYLFNSSLANAIIASSRSKEFPPMPETVRKGLQTYWSANEAATIINNSSQKTKNDNTYKNDVDTLENVNELKATFVPCVESTMNAISGGAMIDERCRRYTAAILYSQIERQDKFTETHKDNFVNHETNQTVWSADDVVCVQAMEGFGFLYAVKKYTPELPVAIIRTASNYDMYPQQKMYLSKELSEQLLSERMPHLYNKLFKHHKDNESNSDSVQDIRAYTWRQNEEYTSIAEHESFVLSSFHYSIQTVTFVLSNYFLGGRDLVNNERH